jgi:Helix-turn-helix domain of resolvase
LYQASPKLGVAHLSVTKNGDSRDVPLSRRSKRCRSFASGASNNSECFLTGSAVRLAFEHLRVRAGMSDLHFHDLPKLAGVYKGRPASIDVSQVRRLKENGMGPSEIAKAINIGRASIYRALA